MLLPRYTLMGVTGFGVDLAVFSVLLYVCMAHYLVATIIGFVVGSSVTYLLSCRYVFDPQVRSVSRSYAVFLSISVGAVALTSLGMYLAVDRMEAGPVPARVIVASLIGMVSFVLHKKVSFRHREKGTPYD